VEYNELQLYEVVVRGRQEQDSLELSNLLHVEARILDYILVTTKETNHQRLSTCNRSNLCQALEHAMI
jgi:hypothetical protein